MKQMTDSGRFQPITGQLWDHAPAQVNQESLIRVTGLIQFGATLLNIMIILRYFLNLLQASAGHPFARLIHNTTDPFVSVFEGVTRSPRFMDVALELDTLLAIIAYSLIAWIAVRLVRIMFASPK